MPSCQYATKRYHGAPFGGLSKVERTTCAIILTWRKLEIAELHLRQNFRLSPVTKDTAPQRPWVDISPQLSRRFLCVGYVLFTRPIMADAAGGKYQCSSRNANATRTSSIALSVSRRPISTRRREFQNYVAPSMLNHVNSGGLAKPYSA